MALGSERRNNKNREEERGRTPKREGKNEDASWDGSGGRGEGDRGARPQAEPDLGIHVFYSSSFILILST